VVERRIFNILVKQYQDGKISSGEVLDGLGISRERFDRLLELRKILDNNADTEEAFISLLLVCIYADGGRFDDEPVLSKALTPEEKRRGILGMMKAVLEEGKTGEFNLLFLELATMQKETIKELERKVSEPSAWERRY